MSAAHRGSPEHHLVLPAAGSHVLAPGDPCTGIVVRALSVAPPSSIYPRRRQLGTHACAPPLRALTCDSERSTWTWHTHQHRTVGTALFALAPVPGVQTPELVYRAFGAAGIAGRFLSNCWLTSGFLKTGWSSSHVRVSGSARSCSPPRVLQHFCKKVLQFYHN